MQLTRIDLNSWLLRLADKTVLIDPWLVEPMVIYHPWLFELRRQQAAPFTPATLPPVDLILLSQDLDDHSHRPTLAQLDRSIPVVATPEAARIARSLGYNSVTPLTNWQTHQLGSLRITAVPGAKIQGVQENGYLLQSASQGDDCTLYYEPHTVAPAMQRQLAQQVGRVDVLVVPVVGQVFPVLGQVIMGPEEALAVVQAVQPRAVVPTALVSDSMQVSGLLPKLIRSLGSVAEFQDRLKASGLATQLYTPGPGETVEFAAIPSTFSP
ncbi:MBL fold metallo-hydrolase [Leptolyngbya sp. FACHB-261]|uniref:MBL fold metallo-hydrolase n=1 Tax=Leptolyngbya sp. FACHB-261 TaxID=2692806 RepID=UPI0016888309|nr:MBL fold metallo-hydrolase [Leptolyngbya sp. FACHB-261]MBD2103726.1 MBL fold metallo-hydrolase [Leptolyngbya sp. FACHB-261]